MAKKKVWDGDIESYSVDWGKEVTSGLPYAGSSVQKFIKDELQSKVGYVARSLQQVAGFYHLYGFKNKAEYDIWLDNPDSIEPIFDMQLPNADTYEVSLTTSSNTDKLVNLGEGVKVDIRYTSTSTPTGGTPVDTDNEGTLTIQRSYNGGAWTTVATMTIQPFSINKPGYQTIDITKYLLDGDNRIRMRVTDNVNGSVSPNVTFNSVVNTSLTIKNALDISKPLTSASFAYFIQGQVAKTLHIKITPDGGQAKTYNYPLGENIYVETPYHIAIGDTYNTGTITVEAWLSVDGADLESEHNITQFYYINGVSTDSVLILNNQVSEVTNFVNTKFFDFTIYNKKSDVTVTISNSTGTVKYLEYIYANCDVNTTYEFYNTLEIDSQLTTINATVTVSTTDMTKTFDITIDNTENMNPTVGADFVLNPKVRSNSESTPGIIRNSVNDNIIVSEWDGFSFQDDGWVLDNDGIGVLRIPAGRSISIDYDPLDSISNTEGTTIELDFKVSNVFDDNNELASFKSYNGDTMLGFQMNTTEAYFMTSGNQVKRDQDVMFQDEERTHLAINIIPNLSNSGLNYIRIFINGIMNREMLYSRSDAFKVGVVKMIFGSETCKCDLDIYSIRVYKKSLSASDIRQDYMSSLPTSEAKIKFREMNDILGADGTISFDKASAKYNTLIWVGKHPEYYQKDYDKSAGTLKINIIGDPDHSGTITNLRIKGQGSSSKTYWRWNHQYDMGKVKAKDEEGKSVTLDSIWTDGNGVEHNGYYILTDGDPKCKKLVSKLNWASSMQSHKIGSTALYNDMWKEVVGGSGITKIDKYKNCRVAVHELPFLYFFQENESSQPVFGGLVTFGSGKADKPTFGIDINKTEEGKKYILIEGSDNGMPLTMRFVPWLDNEVSYNPDEEYYEYNKQGSWDFDAGKTVVKDDGKEYPADGLINPFKNAFNFTYLHSPYLRPDNIDDSSKDVKYQYWNTESYIVRRYDYITKTWVDAGAQKDDNDEWSICELNIVDQTGVTPTGNIEEDNEAFIQARKTEFKEGIKNIYNVDDTLFSMAMVKLLAASDNWCKNTYEYFDPIDKIIRFVQDDLDTIKLTDNVGRKNKPYYVEEHDTNEKGEKFWNSDENTFYVLMEQCFESDLKNMMTRILDAMVSKFGSVDKCLQHYYFWVQEYFPAVAYNETARILYEEASVKQSSGEYKNNTTAISQSLGDQLQAEKQWWKRRVPYIQSWASSSPFNVAGQSSGSLSFRSVMRKNPSNPTGDLINPVFNFNLTTWQWLYPKVGVGQSLPAGDTRVPSNTKYDSPELNADGNTNIFIYGNDYYTNYGEFGGVSLGEKFPLSGKHLLEFSADSREVTDFNFRPTEISLACPSLKKLILYGVSTLTGLIDLKNASRLEEVDLRGTNITSVIFPSSYNLRVAQLPDTLSGITLNNCPNIEMSYFDTVSYNNIISISTDNNDLIKKALYGSDKLSIVNLTNIKIDLTEISDKDQSTLLSNRLYDALINPGSSCSGEVILDMELTAAQKEKLISKYNSIDDPDGALYIKYTLKHGTPTLTGPTEVALGRKVVLDFSYDGNDVKRYDWVVTGADSYIVSASGITITAPTDEAAVGRKITVTCTPIYIGSPSETISWNIDIIDAIVIERIEVNNMYIHEGSTTLNINYVPENYTIDVSKVEVNTGENAYISRVGFDKNHVEYQRTSAEITDVIKTVPVDITITDEENRSFSASVTLYIDNPITEWYLVDKNDNETKIN